LFVLPERLTTEAVTAETRIPVRPAFANTFVGRSAFSNQFDNAKINENIANSIVIGVKSLCSSLFFEVTFPNVFNKNNPVMSHKA
jgi:hypothetical protein